MDVENPFDYMRAMQQDPYRMACEQCRRKHETTHIQATQQGKVAQLLQQESRHLGQRGALAIKGHNESTRSHRLFSMAAAAQSLSSACQSRQARRQ